MMTVPATEVTPTADHSRRSGDGHAPTRRVEGRMLERLYRCHAGRMMNFLRRLGLSDDAAEDALQEVFLTAHRKWDTFRGDAQPSTWLHGIAIRVARRHRALAEKRIRQAIPPLSADGQPSPEDAVLRDESLKLLDAVLAQLPEGKRELLLLAEVQQLTAPEIASVLGIPTNTVYTRLASARALFRRLVSRARFVRSEKRP